MTTKGKRPLRHLTASDKIDAIQRIHDGESKASVARDIGVPESTLRGWCKNEDKLRFMSRQSAPDKMGSDSLADKLADGAAAAAAAVSLLAGPPEKRQKLDPGMPLNFSNKIKYEDLAYKRSPLNGLDFSTNKALSDLSFNGLAQDYSAFPKSDMSALNGSCKTKGYGADLSKQNDPSKTDLSMAAISPLTSLSHLSGMTGLAQSPLALSFNEIASNLNLIAQLNNPNLAAMTGLNGLSTPGGIVGAGGGGGGGNSIRNLKPKPPAHSPRSENDKPQGLSVKNWAKCQQKNSNDSFGMNLSDCKPKLKSSAQQLSRDAPVDDALWYWLKSQQTMLGLNNLYTSIPSSSPIRSSTPQQQVPHHNHSTSTPPIGSTPQTPSSTPSGSSEDTKNSSWFWQWYKTFGANFMGDKQQPQISHSLLNHSNGLNGSVSSTHNNHLNSNSSLLNNHHNNNNNNNNDNIANNNTIDMSKPPFDNILYSHLTKDAIMNVDNLNNNETNNNNINTDTINNNITNKPEDLSAKPSVKEELTDKDVVRSEADTNSTNAKETLDNTSFSPIANNNHHIDSSSMSNNSHEHNNTTSNMNMNTSSSHINSSGSCGGDEAKSEECDSDDVCGPQEALEHGEKFLKWLESYSDPRVTAMQVMQFKYLLNGIRSGAEQTVSSESDRTRIRRRK